MKNKVRKIVYQVLWVDGCVDYFSQKQFNRIMADNRLRKLVVFHTRRREYFKDNRLEVNNDCNS
ncbi:MAG: hypothetical protein PHS04_11130 [Tissierellia bacterium]|nr:hypothetical protein [Tissierellia bacterium]